MHLVASPIGLEGAIVLQLGPADRARLALHTLGSVVTFVLAAGGFAAGARLVGAARATAVVFGFAFGVLVWNLVRLLYAGSGLAPATTEDEAARWRPSAWPLVVFLVVGGAMAQPVLTLGAGGVTSAEVAAYRARLVTLHAEANLSPLEAEVADARQTVKELRASVAAADAQQHDLEGSAESDADRLALSEGADDLRTLREELTRAEGKRARDEAKVEETKLTDIAPYERHVASLPLPLFRMRTAWRSSTRSALFTLFYSLLFSAPVLLRAFAPRTLLGYEQRRRETDRRRIEAIHLQTVRYVARARLQRLSAWPEGHLALHAPFHHEGSAFLDPPFNRVPRVSEEAKARLADRAERRALQRARRASR